jgi:hypothetical protein
VEDYEKLPEEYNKFFLTGDLLRHRQRLLRATCASAITFVSLTPSQKLWRHAIGDHRKLWRHAVCFLFYVADKKGNRTAMGAVRKNDKRTEYSIRLPQERYL